ncbi:MAG TPA: hypothetical protein VMZ52_19710 [Bryobacteraceae bacterium]|nr:hypothetical protein [Bryobacteraceae bacterium]
MTSRLSQSTGYSRRDFLAASALAPLKPQATADRKFYAGAATVNITPTLGAPIAGNMTYAPAAEVHDELHVKSLVLDNDRMRLAFAVVDSCMVPGDIIARAKRLIQDHTGIPPANVLISATHTHSAPAATHLFQSEPDPKYVEWLTTRIADSVRIAVQRLEPARIGWGVGREERLLFCRRYFMKPGSIPPNPFGNTTERVQMNPPAGSPDILGPEGPVDPDVGIIAVESRQGRPICVIGNYALHYVGGVGKAHISADYFAYWADSMARLAGIQPNSGFPPFVAILTNACSGHDVSLDHRAAQKASPPYVRMESVAGVLAAESYRTWRGIHFQDWAELGASQDELEFAVRLPSREDVAEARKILAAKGWSAGSNAQLTDRRDIYARETIYLAEYPKSIQTIVQALRIGSMGIATFPGEAFAELGLEVKAKSPFKPAMLIELANDYRGYIPTPEAHGNGGYETWRAKSSYLEVMAAPKMVASAVRQLAKLA